MTQIERKLIASFIDFKKRQGKATSIVFQSMPEKGVWLSDGFYSYKTIIEQFTTRLRETGQNDKLLNLLTKDNK
jgi:predicted metal-dependent phosphotriesterase family hydrolase